MALRFGIAGTGYWAREVHVPGLFGIPGAKPVAVWGRSVEATRAIAERHGLVAFDDFSAMLDAVDAVSFAVPPDVQASLALEAARAGKHVMLEKPLARTTAAAEAIARELASRNLCSVVFFMRRFVPEVERAVGEAARSRWRRAIVRVHSSALTSGGPYADSVWRQAPGGALWDLGPHVFSMLIPILGAVTAVASERVEGPALRFVSEHASGAGADVSLTLHAPPGSSATEYRLESSTATITLPAPAFSFPDMYRNAVGELIENIRRGTSCHRCDANFAVEVVRVLELIEHSRASGERLALMKSSH